MTRIRAGAVNQVAGELELEDGRVVPIRAINARQSRAMKAIHRAPDPDADEKVYAIAAELLPDLTPDEGAGYVSLHFGLYGKTCRH